MICKTIRERFQCVKQIGYVLLAKKKGIKMELFFLRKNDDNNFILQLFVSG